MRMAILGLGLISLIGCANQHPLAQVSVDDPVWKIAPERWSDATNNLTQPPTNPAGRLPQQTSAR